MPGIEPVRATSAPTAIHTVEIARLAFPEEPICDKTNRHTPRTASEHPTLSGIRERMKIGTATPNAATIRMNTATSGRPGGEIVDGTRVVGAAMLGYA
ncbi:MAG: hypothetical protein ACLP8Y_09195 [Thermoplasmata archaeon]